MSLKIERLLENFTLGEGPHWDEEAGCLYFVDIMGYTINKYDPTTKIHTKANVGNDVSFIIPIQNSNKEFLIGLGPNLAKIAWDGASEQVSKVEILATTDNSNEVRFNDAKVDPNGRLWLGTMGFIKKTGKQVKGKGYLYSYDKGKLVEHLNSVDISNGLAWNLSLNKFYYIDTGRRTVDQFDYDFEKGTIANREVIFTPSKHNLPGRPDGQTIDSDGNLWVALFAGSRIIKIDPRKPETLLEVIELPAKQITSATFGGPNFEDLYVTTANFVTELEGEVLSPPMHGALYRISNINAKGFPAVKVKV